LALRELIMKTTAIPALRLQLPSGSRLTARVAIFFYVVVYTMWLKRQTSQREFMSSSSLDPCRNL
jgi:heme O synthase-like polyprenyltransferase